MNFSWLISDKLIELNCSNSNNPVSGPLVNFLSKNRNSTAVADISIEAKFFNNWRIRRNSGVTESVDGKGTRSIQIERHDLVGKILEENDRYTGEFAVNGDEEYVIGVLIKTLLSFVCEDRKELLLHASALIRKKRLWLFCGESGSGKSTIVEELNNGGRIFSHDLVVLQRRNGEWGVHSTPFSDGDNTIFPKYYKFKPIIVFIKQSLKPKIVELTTHEKIRNLLAETIAHSQTREKRMKTLDAMASIAMSVDCFRLEFSKDEAFWKLLDKRAFDS